MASNHSKIVELSARVEGILQQFSGEEYGYEPEEKKKRKNPLLRAGMAGGAVAGYAALSGRKEQMKAAGRAGMERAGSMVESARGRIASELPGLKKSAREAGFKGVRGVASGLDAGAKGLKKGAGFLRRKSWRIRGFSSAELAQRLVRIDAGLRKFGI